MRNQVRNVVFILCAGGLLVAAAHLVVTPRERVMAKMLSPQTYQEDSHYFKDADTGQWRKAKNPTEVLAGNEENVAGIYRIMLRICENNDLVAPQPRIAEIGQSTASGSIRKATQDFLAHQKTASEQPVPGEVPNAAPRK